MILANIRQKIAAVTMLSIIVSIPITASATELQRIGYTNDGNEICGLVSVGDTTWCWRGGKKVIDEQVDVQGGWRYFGKESGIMARNSWINVSMPEGKYAHFNADGIRDGFRNDNGTEIKGDVNEKNANYNNTNVNSTNGNNTTNTNANTNTNSNTNATTNSNVNSNKHDDTNKNSNSGSTQKPATTKPVTQDILKAGWYNLTVTGTNLRLDIDGAKSSDNTKVYLQNADDGRGIEQKFRITWPDSTRVKIESPMGVLRVRDASKNEGTTVTQCPEGGIEAERWYPERDTNGNYMFRNAVNGGVLSVSSASESETVKCLKDTGGSTQRWMLSTCGGFTGWWTDINGAVHCTDPSSAMMFHDTKHVDPYQSNYGSIYDFDHSGNASWHLPTYADLPNGYGPDVAVPNITQGDRRQRTILYALSRVGCPYGLGGIPTKFVCDGLTNWSYINGAGDSSYDGDASYQWQAVKDRNGIKSNISDLKPGDFVFFGNAQVTYGPGSIDYNGDAYHAGIYYGNGQMINARNEGLELSDIETYWMKPFLGGGSPYTTETSMVPIPHM